MRSNRETRRFDEKLGDSWENWESWQVCNQLFKDWTILRVVPFNQAIKAYKKCFKKCFNDLILNKLLTDINLLLLRRMEMLVHYLMCPIQFMRLSMGTPRLRCRRIFFFFHVNLRFLKADLCFMD